MAGATAPLVMQSTGAKDLPEVFTSVPPFSGAAQGHHGNASSTANLQPASPDYAGNPLATGQLDLPKVQKQSSS